MVRSPGFGSITSDKRPIQARFHCGSSIHCFNLPLTMSRRLILQQARSQTLNSRSPTACKFMVSCSFHSPPGVLFTFPSRYYFTIGHSVIFSLTRWSSQIHTEFHVFHATWDSIWLFSIFKYETITLYGQVFQTCSSNCWRIVMLVPLPLILN